MNYTVRVSVSDLFFCLGKLSWKFVNNHGIVYLQALLKALVVHQPVRLLNVLAK
jgi:hypothetical protein